MLNITLKTSTTTKTATTKTHKWRKQKNNNNSNDDKNNNNYDDNNNNNNNKIKSTMIISSSVNFPNLLISGWSGSKVANVSPFSRVVKDFCLKKILTFHLSKTFVWKKNNWLLSCQRLKFEKNNWLLSCWRLKFEKESMFIFAFSLWKQNVLNNQTFLFN